MHASYYHKAHACIMVRVVSRQRPGGIWTQPSQPAPGLVVTVYGYTRPYISCLFQCLRNFPVLFFLLSPGRSSVVGYV